MKSEYEKHSEYSDEVCESCGGSQGIPRDPHPCPYREEMEGDIVSTCNCCDECTNDCCQDI
jgi:hypothetical protein